MTQRRKLRFLSLLTVVAAAGGLMNLPSAHASSTGNLIYHGGPVMAGNMKAYVIFWEPSGSFVSSTYNELLQRYFRDIGDSGLYANNQQYTQTDGRAPTHAKLAGTFVDTSPYPSAPLLPDADLQHEIMHAMSVQGWTPGINHAFFVYTALNELICLPPVFGGTCSQPRGHTCAYHFGFPAPEGVVLYGAGLMRQASSTVKSGTNARASMACWMRPEPTSMSTVIPISSRKSGTTQSLAVPLAGRSLR